MLKGSGIVLTIAGVIGSGKSTLTKILTDKLGTTPFYEPVDDNPVLPLFYEGNKLVEEGKRKTNPYAFLLQVYFLNKRFKAIKEALSGGNNTLDRSIYEDTLFAKMNYDKGSMTKTEWDMYSELLDNMMEEVHGLPKKSPDLMILIKVSYPTMIKRIKKRGREFEQLTYDASLEEYYKDLINRYEQWEKEYNKSPLLVIDGDKYDFVSNKEDLEIVLKQIYDKMLEVKCITKEEHDKLINSI